MQGVEAYEGDFELIYYKKCFAAGVSLFPK